MMLKKEFKGCSPFPTPNPNHHPCGGSGLPGPASYLCIHSIHKKNYQFMYKKNKELKKTMNNILILNK